MEKRKVKAKVKVREGAERKEEGKERKTWKGIRRHGRKKKTTRKRWEEKGREENINAKGGERKERKQVRGEGRRKKRKGGKTRK